MDKISVFSFTDKGLLLAEWVADKINASDMGAAAVPLRVKDLREQTGAAFVRDAAIVFVGAAGIAVRAVAPYLKNKTSDPAVIVIDEDGKYTVPILSGHIGGANRYARGIAAAIGAVPVITTATDVNGVFSVDAFASENGYFVANPECVKHISSALLEGREVGLCSDFEVAGALPAGLISGESGSEGICISLDGEKKPFDKTLTLMPKCLHAGMGCRKDADPEAVEGLFAEAMNSLPAPIETAASVSSIDLKNNEKALISLAVKYRIRFVTYSAAELNEVARLFGQSDFVKRATGAGNVCEASAYLASKRGAVVFPKYAKNGATISIAREFWRVSFESYNGGARP